jgi:GT2 family glycosyltransferase
MLSLVCVYNNQDVLDNYLLKSLKNQSKEYELILMDNTQGKYNSAAEALNKGGKDAKGRYIMFIHQDVDLNSDLCLEKIEKLLDTIPNLGIAGAAGISKKGVITNIMHGEPPQLAGENQNNEPLKVQTLDECLIIIPRNIFDSYEFDEETCDDWHSYAIDYSLMIKSKGFDVYFVPINIYHKSTGTPIAEEYYTSLEKVRRKHRKNYRLIYTTTGEWSTLYSISLQRKAFFQVRLINILKRIGLF